MSFHYKNQKGQQARGNIKRLHEVHAKPDKISKQ